MDPCTTSTEQRAHSENDVAATLGVAGPEAAKASALEEVDVRVFVLRCERARNTLQGAHRLLDGRLVVLAFALVYLRWQHLQRAQCWVLRRHRHARQVQLHLTYTAH